jgi:hypothetical protein
MVEYGGCLELDLSHLEDSIESMLRTESNRVSNTRSKTQTQAFWWMGRKSGITKNQANEKFVV